MEILYSFLPWVGAAAVFVATVWTVFLFMESLPNLISAQSPMSTWYDPQDEAFRVALEKYFHKEKTLAPLRHIVAILGIVAIFSLSSFLVYWLFHSFPAFGLSGGLSWPMAISTSVSLFIWWVLGGMFAESNTGVQQRSKHAGWKKFLEVTWSVVKSLVIWIGLLALIWLVLYSIVNTVASWL